MFIFFTETTITVVLILCNNIEAWGFAFHYFFFIIVCRGLEWWRSSGSRRRQDIFHKNRYLNVFTKMEACGWLMAMCYHSPLTNRALSPFAGLSGWLPAGPPPTGGPGLWPLSASSSPPPSLLTGPATSAAAPMGQRGCEAVDRADRQCNQSQLLNHFGKGEKLLD